MAEPLAETTSSVPRPSKWRPVKRLLLVTIRALVLVALGWAIWKTWQETDGNLAAEGFSWKEIQFGWFAGSAALFALGMFPASIFWWQLLRAMGQKPQFLPAIRAYFVGGLGKYVPGKALVVVVRSQMVAGPGVDWRIAAASVFAETFTMMAVGGLIGAALIGLLFREHVELLGASLTVAVLLGIPTTPFIFRRLIGWIGKRRGIQLSGEALHGLNMRFMLRGWLLLACGWSILGLSVWCAARAIPGDSRPSIDFLSEWGLTTACASLGVVAGFVAQMPAGIGAREWVVIQLTKPYYGGVNAVLAAALMRIAWLLSEIMVSIILYWIIQPAHPSRQDGQDSPANTSL